MRSPLRWLIVALLVVHAASALRVAAESDWFHARFASGDNIRYHEIASAPGLPYRDHAVEYPPLSWGFIELLDRSSNLETTGRILVATQILADAAIAFALVYGWGTSAGVAWLALLLPLVWEGWIYGRFDLLSVAVAMWGLALARRHRERLGGALVGLGFFIKTWPIVTVPGFAVERRPRALKTAVFTVAGGLVAWFALGGLQGFQQVLSFRGARGWQIESSVGSLYLLDSTLPTLSEEGALRIGHATGLQKGALAALLVAGLVITWLLAARAARAGRTSAADVSALAEIVCVVLLLVLSPLLSPQYLVWLIPFVAIRWKDWSITILTLTATVFTALVARNYNQLLNNGTGWVLLLISRNVLLVCIALVGVRRLLALGHAPSASVSPSGASVTARLP